MVAAAHAPPLSASSEETEEKRRELERLLADPRSAASPETAWRLREMALSPGGLVNGAFI
jgi:threonine synthase